MIANALPRILGSIDRVLLALAATSVAFVVVFFTVPRILTSASAGRTFDSEDSLSTKARDVFVDYWASGDPGFPSELQTLSEYWVRYHVVKAVVAALVLASAVAFGWLLARRYIASTDLGRGRRLAFAGTGVVASFLAVFSVAAIVANIQGAVVPFSSLLSLLPVGAPDGQLAATMKEIELRLADGRWTPLLESMIRDFGDYHSAMAVTASCAAVVIVGSSALTWTRFARTAASEHQTRRVLGWVGVVTTVVSLALVMIVVANAGTAADPAPALATFFGGGVL